jgi:thiol-disulfide isomerase/thioredoxin
MRAYVPSLLRAHRAALQPRPRLLYPNPLRCHPARGLGCTPPVLGANRVYQAVRSPADLDTLLLHAAAARVPLLTLWTASWCTACKRAAPYVLSAVEDAGFGEAAGGVAFAEVEFDAPGNVELGERYMVSGPDVFV